MDTRNPESGGNRSVEDEKEGWSYFDSYKYSGRGDAVSRPKMEEFHHISDERKLNDIRLVESKKGRPGLTRQKELGADAFAFENFLTTQIIRHDWLGGKASVTTEYDDWIAGADAVVEWPAPSEGAHPIRLAIDFTATERTDIFSNKSEKLTGNVRIKYLRSLVELDEGKPKEISEMMPLVLLGFDKSVYRAVAERNEKMGPEHPLGVYLLRQASAQIDLQIELLVSSSFQSKRSRRSEGANEISKVIEQKGDDILVEEVIKLIQTLDQKTMNEVMNPKTQARLYSLLKLKVVLDKALEQAEEILMDDFWKSLLNSSKTHQVLSS